MCELCPHRCRLEEGEKGLCGARSNRGGKIVSDSYGKITSLALDPIEKKPFRRFYPGSHILSAGSFGCNMKCPFCQNSDISMSTGCEPKTQIISPKELTELAVAAVTSGNIGIAHTYNEPIINYEYVFDCAQLIAAIGLKTVIVTNGMICEQPLNALLDVVDAMNIDLKSFDPAYYKKIGGNLSAVQETIKHAISRCHVEVTTLLVTDDNDDMQGIEEMAVWLASLNPEISLHITRFFPRWQYTDRLPTDVRRVHEAAEVARRYLRYVYVGNC